MSFKGDNVASLLQSSFVLLPYKDIELLVFSVVYRIGLASADLSCAKLERSIYRWWKTCLFFLKMCLETFLSRSFGLYILFTFFQ